MKENFLLYNKNQQTLKRFTHFILAQQQGKVVIRENLLIGVLITKFSDYNANVLHALNAYS